MSDNAEKSVIFTHQEVAEYATIECVGQYLLAAYLVNSAFVPNRNEIGTLVDFGCGAGKSTRAVAPSVRPGEHVIGVDVSEDFLVQARLLTNRSIATAGLTRQSNQLLHVRHFDFVKIDVVGDEERILLQDDIADAVTTSIVLQEFQTEALLRSALGEMGRIAKSGAKLAAAVVSDKITCEDYTTFTYAPFLDNAQRNDNVRKCQSTVSKIVWEHDRHWSKEILIDGLQAGGWGEVVAEYPIAPPDLKPFPNSPNISWKDESKSAALLLLTATKK